MTPSIQPGQAIVANPSFWNDAVQVIAPLRIARGEGVDVVGHLLATPP